MDAAAGGRLKSIALSESGYYLLQRGDRDGDDRVSVLMDCGELGFLSLAAHGHADSLSLNVRVGGHDVLVDPGTFDYFADEQWRRYFRSTRAHNTIEMATGAFVGGGIEWRFPQSSGLSVINNLFNVPVNVRSNAQALTEGNLEIEDLGAVVVSPGDDYRLNASASR